MRFLIFFIPLALLIIENSFTQEQPEIPKIDIYYDNYFQTHKTLDSVIQYTFASINDSSQFRKWEYLHNETGDFHQTLRFSWNKEFKEWNHPFDRFEFSFDKVGRPIIKAHYHYLVSQGVWKGCAVDGCGKQEWVYDGMGNQILWTQSYWNMDGRDWIKYQVQENLYDLNGNMVLETYKERYQFDLSHWYGNKNEYSYDNDNNQIGHAIYSWAGRDPFDWRPRKKEERSYDSLGNITVYTFLEWSEGKWIGDNLWPIGWSRVELKRNSNGHKKSVILYKWNNDQSDWILDFEEENVYDTYGQLISEMEIYLSPHSMEYGFDPIRKVYGYNTRGEKIWEISTSWNAWLGNWRDPEKQEYTYDADGNQVIRIKYSWDKVIGNWLEHEKIEKSYDSYRNNILYTSYNWDPELDDWIGSLRYMKKYDINGKVISEEYYLWNRDLSNWVGKLNGQGKIEYEYDDSDNMVLYASFQWDSVLNEWKGHNNGKFGWEYNTTGQLIKEIHYEWDLESAHWKEKTKSLIIYDEIDDPIQQEQFIWNIDSNDWEITSRYLCHYKSSVSSKVDNDVDCILIYPNPTLGKINITGLNHPAEVKVYSIQGKLIKKFNQLENTIDISDQSAGIYLLCISFGYNGLLMKTVVKK